MLLAAFVGLPVALAALASYLLGSAFLGPVLLIGVGVVFFVVGFRLLRRFDRQASEVGIDLRELDEGEEGAKFMLDHRRATVIWLHLQLAGFVLPPLGLAWLLVTAVVVLVT